MNKSDTLSELTLNITDGKHGDCVDEENSGFYFVSSKDVFDGQIHLEEARQITEADYIDTHRRTQLEANDILITNSGSIGRLCFLKPTDKTEGITFQKSVAVIKPNPEKVFPKYLYYNFSYHVTLLIRRAVGSNQKNLLLSDLRELELNYHDNKTEQKEIADILTAVDEKIFLNNRINQELEEMAKTIYNYWFVQFDFPNAEGKPYKTSGGEMEWSEELKREIPKGWKKGKLSEVANITMGQSPEGSSYNEEGEGMVFYQGSTDFNFRFPEIRMYTTEPTRFAKEEDILLSVRAPVGTINVANEDCCIGRGLAALNSKNGTQSYLLYLMFYFKSMFDIQNRTGTTFGSIDKDTLYDLSFPKPPIDLQKRFQEIVGKYDAMILSRSRENQELIKLRDFLLPMLMNGQVKVKSEAKEQLSMAAEPQVKYGK